MGSLVHSSMQYWIIFSLLLSFLDSPVSQCLIINPRGLSWGISSKSLPFLVFLGPLCGSFGPGFLLFPWPILTGAPESGVPKIPPFAAASSLRWPSPSRETGTTAGRTPHWLRGWAASHSHTVFLPPNRTMLTVRCSRPGLRAPELQVNFSADSGELNSLLTSYFSSSRWSLEPPQPEPRDRGAPPDPGSTRMIQGDHVGVTRLL